MSATDRRPESTASPATVAITKLSLRRFRSHTRFEAAFTAGVVAIYGANGAGKTNLLEAVATLSPGRGLRGAPAEEMAQRPEPVGWSVAADLEAGAPPQDAAADAGEGPARAALQIVYELPARRRTARIDGDAAPMTEFARRLRLIWLTPAMDRLWIEGAAGRRRYIDRLTLAFDAAHGERSALYERALRERNRLLKEPRPDGSWLDAVEQRLSDAGVAILAARQATLEAVTEAQGGTTGDFPVADLTLTGEIEAALAAAAPADRAAELARRLASDRRGDAMAGRTRLGPHRSDLVAVHRGADMPAAQCSTGEQKALLLSLTLASARAVGARYGRRPVLLLDEIAAHLDPDRRAALFGALAGLGCQAFLTGVSEAEFAALPISAQRFAIMRG